MYTNGIFTQKYMKCYESPTQSQVSLMSCIKELLANRIFLH